MAAADPLRKLPRRRPPGLGPQRRRRGTRPMTSSVDSAAVRRHASRLCRRRSPRPCTSLIAPCRSLRRSETQRFRSAEALVAKPFFNNDRWFPPLHINAFRLSEMAVVVALSPPFSADSELALELRSGVRRWHCAAARLPHTRTRSSAAAKAFRDAVVVRGSSC